MESLIDEPYVKILLLIVPAIIVVIRVMLSPMIEKKKFRDNLLGKPITVIVEVIDDENMSYKTSGTIYKITDKTLEIKRKTQPLFRVPYEPQRIIKTSSSKNKEYYIINYFIKTRKILDENRGLFF